MKVLHLYANHKWTGPADPALLLARALLGPVVAGGGRLDWAVAGFVHEGLDHAVRARATELGLPQREGLALRRHFHLRSQLADARRLAHWLDDGDYDLLHCHQKGDHAVASLALSMAGRKVPVVRSLWEERIPLALPRQALAFGRTAAVLTPFADQVPLLEARYGLGRGRVLVQEPLLEQAPAGGTSPDVARAALLEELGLDDGALLLGITARIQRRRRWELLWDLLAALAPRFPALALVVLGRPDEGVFDELCAGPLRARGLQDRVRFLGYRRGDAYRDVLRALDLFVFLVPGSDPTCRALREAMAAGCAVVTTDLGRLPELVADGETGLVREPAPEPLAEAAGALLADPDARRRLGAAAAAAARDRWGGAAQVAQTMALYGALCGGRS
ncbi:MAG: glycosyltransferase [Planctomycetota bacterium]